MAFFVVGIVALVIMLGYSILAAAMPRSGGGYVAISRIINPFAGFVASWVEFLSISWSFGIIAATVVWLALYIVGPSLLPIQFNAIVNATSSYGDVVLTLGGLSLVIIFTVVAAFGVKLTGYVLQVLFWVPAILTLYVLYLLGSAIMSPAVLERGISAWAQSQGVAGVTADTYVKAALAQGLDGANVGNYWTAVSVSLAGAYFAYVGYAATTFVVGEVKEPKRNLPKVLIIATIVIIVLYVTNGYFAVYAASSVGQITLPNGDRWSFFDAYSFLSYRGKPESSWSANWPTSCSHTCRNVRHGPWTRFAEYSPILILCTMARKRYSAVHSNSLPNPIRNVVRQSSAGIFG